MHTTTEDAGQACAAGFDAILTRAEAQKIEDDQERIWRPRRRVALGTLQRSIDELAATGPTLLLDMFSLVDDWHDHLLICAEMAEDARNRLLLAASQFAKEPRHGCR
jgi:hypothetical protein